MDGRSVHYDLPIDWYTLRRWVLEKRMEQVWEIDGERTYEKMRCAVERASQPLMPSQFFLSHVGPRTEPRWSRSGTMAPAASSLSRVSPSSLPNSRHHHVIHTEVFRELSGDPMARAVRWLSSCPIKNSSLQFRRSFLGSLASMSRVQSRQAVFFEALLPSTDVAPIATGVVARPGANR